MNGQCHHPSHDSDQPNSGAGQSRSPLPHNEAPQPAQTQHLRVTSSSGSRNHAGSGSQRIPLASIPQISKWFAYLDQDEERSGDGIVFTPFGDILKARGIVRLSQLSDRYIKLSDLEQWLGIDTGTAITIFQYANEDLEAIKSGEWVFPS